jgi:hypothetical protein
VKEVFLAHMRIFEESQDQDAKAVLMDLLDLAETQALLDNREPLEDQEVLDPPETLDSQVSPVHQDNLVNLDSLVHQAPLEVLASPESKARRDDPVHLGHLEASDPKDRLALLEAQAILDPLARMVSPVPADSQAKEDSQDNPAILAVRVHQEKTRNTVLALDAAEISKIVFQLRILHNFYSISLITCFILPEIYFILSPYYFFETIFKMTHTSNIIFFHEKIEHR